jgi:hypothetical protein
LSSEYMIELPGPLSGTLVLDLKGKHGPLDAAPAAGPPSEKAAAAGCCGGGTWCGGGFAAPVVELGGAGRHLLGVLQETSVFQIGGDAARLEWQPIRVAKPAAVVVTGSQFLLGENPEICTKPRSLIRLGFSCAKYMCETGA